MKQAASLPRVVTVYFCGYVGERFGLGWWIEKCTGWENTHVCIGDGEVVLDSLDRGDRFWPQTVFEAKYPIARIAVDIDVEFDPQLEAVGCRRAPRNKWLRLLRWVTFGMTPVDDCVSSVAKALRLAGVDVPRRVTTPGEIWDLLRPYGRVRMLDGDVYPMDSVGPLDAAGGS